MSENNALGGRDLLGNRLPRGYFDDLSATLWKIGNRAFAEILCEPFAPSQFHGTPLRIGNLALELGFDFRINEAKKAVEATKYRSVLSECEPYPHQDDTEVWTWMRFDLNMLQRRKTFERGTSIISPFGEMQLEDLSSQQGPQAWQEAQKLSRVFSNQDLETYMANLRLVLDGIEAGELES